MIIFEILKAIFLGIIEGITEWLPISSTGHMILFDEFVERITERLPISSIFDEFVVLNVSDEFKEMFFVVIQLGAILAVPTLFFKRLWPFGAGNREQRSSILKLWLKVIVGVIPAAVAGFLLDDLLDEYLYTPWVVAAALVLYGIAFIIIEKLGGSSKRGFRVNTVDELTYKDALLIGAFQMLSLIPGTSRSGSTILGGMLTGVSRVASAEFSFFMAIPVMIGASLLKIVKFAASGTAVTTLEIVLLLIGIVISYLVSLAVIRFLMDFVKRHSFTAFGVYRIVLGAVVIAYFLIAK